MLHPRRLRVVVGKTISEERVEQVAWVCPERTQIESDKEMGRNVHDNDDDDEIDILLCLASNPKRFFILMVHHTR